MRLKEVWRSEFVARIATLAGRSVRAYYYRIFA